MDLYTVDVTARTARHRRRQELENYNAAVDQYRRDQAAEIIRIQEEAEGRVADIEGTDLEKKIGSTQQASLSTLGVTYDILKGNIKSPEKIIPFGLGETELVQKRMGAFESRKLARQGAKARSLALARGKVIPEPPPIPEGGIKVKKPLTVRGDTFVRESIGTTQARLESRALRESEHMLGKSTSKIGKAASKVGKGASVVGKSAAIGIVRHAGPALNIGMGGMDLVEDIQAGEIVGQNTSEKTSNVLQIGSAFAELGSLGIGAAIGAGVLGAAASPAVAGLALLGAGLGVGSAVAEVVGSIGETEEAKEEIKEAEEEDVETIQLETETGPQRKRIEQAGLVQGAIAPKLRG